MNRKLLTDKYLKFPFYSVLSILRTNETFWKFGFDKISLSLCDNKTEIHISERVVEYSCQTSIGDISDKKENIIVICIKDNNHLLKFCLDNIYNNQINKYCDILVLDDRSISDENHFLCLNKNITYCKLENTDNSFNYSLINNIGASYAKLFDKKRILFWNSDLWTDNPHTVENILKEHIDNNSSITGTKLIYPDQSDYKKLLVKKHVLGTTLEHSYNTIQHGGIIFVPSGCIVDNSLLMFMPAHQWRFYPKDYSLASLNGRCFAVTGALHIVNTKDFLDLGGYACALATSYQDIDLCQRAVQNNLSVYYIGSEYMLHAETITNEDGKKYHTSLAHQSDRIIYEYIWQSKMPQLLGMKK